MKIFFKTKKVYGKDLYYPSCILSNLICKLLNRKCLAGYQLEDCKESGLEIIITKEEKENQ